MMSHGHSLSKHGLLWEKELLPGVVVSWPESHGMSFLCKINPNTVCGQTSW